ncbi:cytoplasmic tRNA 2-thiolation protein 1 isoform X2 [Cebus imitator]|uniref:cytoplasmic tRNA 2-thiolation protein 1 isoform X2 n=1 Tax=Cebus imitator TaxID=2715852 RepID=UPI001899BB49|nr:cytoplasmic tRNA 2-thiolation protein 1 isoform X2 [Cebus imitator]
MNLPVTARRHGNNSTHSSAAPWARAQAQKINGAVHFGSSRKSKESVSGSCRPNGTSEPRAQKAKGAVHFGGSRKNNANVSRSRKLSGSPEPLAHPAALPHGILGAVGKEVPRPRGNGSLGVVTSVPGFRVVGSVDVPALRSARLVAVDEGIGGYRDAALAAVRRQAARWELPLTVVAYEDLFGGWTMDAVARSTAGSGRSRSCCTFCGVLRRRALEEGARRVGATHIVTGHNADDMAETVLMNFLRGDAGRLARGGGLGSPGEGGALPRCRPLQFASQKEVVLYAHFRRLDYFSEECVYAPEAFRGHARDLLKRLEAARPSAVLDLVHSAERLALAASARPPRPGACSRCGALASRALCQACALLDGLNRGRPRLAIGKGRRGLDEQATPGTPGDPAQTPTPKAVPTF